MLTERHRRHFRHLHDGSLADGIDQRATSSGHRRNAAGIDNAAGSLLLHDRDGVFHTKENTPHQHIEAHVELFHGNIFDRTEHAAESRIVEDAI